MPCWICSIEKFRKITKLKQKTIESHFNRCRCYNGNCIDLCVFTDNVLGSIFKLTGQIIYVQKKRCFSTKKETTDHFTRLWWCHFVFRKETTLECTTLYRRFMTSKSRVHFSALSLYLHTYKQLSNLKNNVSPFIIRCGSLYRCWCAAPPPCALNGSLEPCSVSFCFHELAVSSGVSYKTNKSA